MMTIRLRSKKHVCGMVCGNNSEVSSLHARTSVLTNDAPAIRLARRAAIGLVAGDGRAVRVGRDPQRQPHARTSDPMPCIFGGPIADLPLHARKPRAAHTLWHSIDFETGLIVQYITLSSAYHW